MKSCIQTEEGFACVNQLVRTVSVKRLKVVSGSVNMVDIINPPSISNTLSSKYKPIFTQATLKKAHAGSDLNFSRKLRYDCNYNKFYKISVTTCSGCRAQKKRFNTTTLIIFLV